MTIDLERHANGIDSPHLQMIDDAVRGYDPRLSLRRVNTSDPDFNPATPWGVWEEGVHREQSPWVFMIPETQLRFDLVLGRIRAGDLMREGVDARMAKMMALQDAQKAEKLAVEQARMAERRDLMEFIGGSPKSALRLTVGGEDVIIDSEVRSPRTHISGSRG